MTDERDIPALDARARLRHERAMRFGYLLSEIELRAKALQAGGEDDIAFALAMIWTNLIEASKLYAEVSREALDKVTEQEPRCPYTEQAQTPYQIIIAGENIQCVLREGHDPPHLMP